MLRGQIKSNERGGKGDACCTGRGKREGSGSAERAQWGQQRATVRVPLLRMYRRGCPALSSLHAHVEPADCAMDGSGDSSTEENGKERRKGRRRWMDGCWPCAIGIHTVGSTTALVDSALPVNSPPCQQRQSKAAAVEPVRCSSDNASSAHQCMS